MEHTIKLTGRVHERLKVVSGLMGVSDSDAVGLLLDRLTADRSAVSDSPHPEANQTSNTGSTSGYVEVFKIYKGHRVEGKFFPSTHELQIDTGPWSGQQFSAPTGAAQAVVEHYSGDDRTTSNTNGRKFWKVKSTGRDLNSIIGQG